MSPMPLRFGPAALARVGAGVVTVIGPIVREILTSVKPFAIRVSGYELGMNHYKSRCLLHACIPAHAGKQSGFKHIVYTSLHLHS